MARFGVYNGYGLTYKEPTHHQSQGRGIWRKNSHSWIRSHATSRGTYRWEKRQASKFVRRQVPIVVAEYAMPAFDPGDQIGVSIYRVANLAGDMVYVYEYERATVFENVRGPNCHICGLYGGH